MTDRAQALAQIVDLAREHDITAHDIAAALNSPSEKASQGIALRLFGYLGGIFIFAGLSAYIGMFWQDMNSAMRVIITLGSGFSLFIIGCLASEKHARSAPPLLLIASFLQPSGLFVGIREYSYGGNDPHYPALAVFGIMLIQQVLTFKALRQPVLLCSSLGFAALLLVTVFDMLHISTDWTSMIIGLSLLLVTYGFEKTPYRNISGFWYFIGSVSFLWGIFDILRQTFIEIGYLAVTCFMVYISVIAQSTTLLVVSVTAMLSYIGYFTKEHFLHSAGWSLSLIVMGMAFFGISAGAIKIKKKYL